ncbi:g7599 [Coccomyxa elongata]
MPIEHADTVRRAASIPEIKDRAKCLGIEFRPLNPVFGAEVLGVDLSQPLPDSTKSLLQDAQWRYGVTLYRGQSMGPAEETNFLLSFPHNESAIAEQRFCNGFFPERVPGHPMLAVRGKTSFVPVWHMDKNELVCPPELCSIYMLKAPAVGGETLYASAVHAYERLSSDQKAFFETLQCEYRADSAFRGLTIHENGVWRVDDVEAAVKLADEDPVELKYGPRYMVHPLVIQDPYTGLKSIFYNTALFTNFVGYSRQQSREILEDALVAATAPELVVEMKWQPGDFVMWSNRMVFHSNTPDVMFNASERHFHLAFLDSKTPVTAAREGVQSMA